MYGLKFGKNMYALKFDKNMYALKFDKKMYGLKFGSARPSSRLTRRWNEGIKELIKQRNLNFEVNAVEAKESSDENDCVWRI